MKSIIGRWVLGWSLVQVLPGSLGLPLARAAELAAGMPKESVLYLEWSGADAVREAFAGTAMSQLLAEPEMQRFTAELEKGVNRLGLASQVPTELKQTAMGFQVVKPLLQHLWRHRVAFSVIGAEPTDTGPSIAAALAIEVGQDGEGFVTAFQGLLTSATARVPKVSETVGNYTFQRMDVSYFPPIRYGVVEDVLWITMGKEVPHDVLAVKNGAAPGLSTNEGLIAARQKLGSTSANTACLLHLDLVRLREQIRPILKGHTGSADFPPPVPTLLEELGVNHINTLTFTEQLADGGYRHAAFLATQGPAKGLLKLFEAKPLTDEDFYPIPADATFFKACNFDLAGAYDEAARIVGILAPQALERFTQQFEQHVGMKLREDLLALFDDGWAVFDAPSQGGLWFTGINVVVETQNVEAFLKALDKLVEAIRKQVGDEKLSLKDCEHNGKKLHYVAITAGPVPVAPAWGAQGNRVVLALFPQMVAQTLDHLASPAVQEHCILTNADFIRGRKLLPATGSMVGYMNTKMGLDDLYRFLLPAATAGCSFAGGHGILLDVSTIPTQSAVTRHLFGDVWSIARDEGGVTVTTHGPLPFPVPFVSGGVNPPTAMVMMTVLLPSLTRARELSKRAVSAAHLKGIGTACMIYAFEHQEKFPPDLEALAAEGSIPRQQLTSPLDPAARPCSYVYIAGQTADSDLRNVLAYEPDPKGEGGNVLFVDGHVEWIRPPRYQQVIDETYKRLGSKPPAK